MPTPGTPQRCCTECPTLFVPGRSDKITCSTTCRSRRKRRVKRGLPEPVSAEQRANIEAGVRATVQDGAVAMAADIMRDELRPIVREQLTPAVLAAIGDMVKLLPLSIEGLKQEMTGVPVFAEDGQPVLARDGKPLMMVDGDRRMKAIAMLHRGTILAPGLAPQPAPEKAPPVAFHVHGVPRPAFEAATTTRECEICHEWHEESAFISGSNRCTGCQDRLEEAARKVVAQP